MAPGKTGHPENLGSVSPLEHPPVIDILLKILHLNQLCFLKISGYTAGKWSHEYKNLVLSKDAVCPPVTAPPIGA